MATTYANAVSGIASTPPVKPTSEAYGARVRRYRAVFTMASQADGDDIILAVIPAGSSFCYGIISATATMGGTATVAIGYTGATGAYRAAATFTSANTPTLFGVVTTGTAAAVLASDTTVRLTIAAAALPSSGTVVVDLYFSYP